MSRIQIILLMPSVMRINSEIWSNRNWRTGIVYYATFEFSCSLFSPIKFSSRKQSYSVLWMSVPHATYRNPLRRQPFSSMVKKKVEFSIYKQITVVHKTVTSFEYPEQIWLVVCLHIILFIYHLFTRYCPLFKSTELSTPTTNVHC